MSDMLSTTDVTDDVAFTLELDEHSTPSSNPVECNCSGVIDASSVASSTSAQRISESANSGQQAWRCCVKQRFGSLFNNKRGSDVTFHVGREPNVRAIPAHTLVLAVASEIFERMFDGHRRANHIEIKFPDNDPAAFFALLRYLYTDEFVVTVDIVVSVLSLAKHYNIFALEKKCSIFFNDNLKPDNVFIFLNQTVQSKEVELLEICLEKIDECIADTISADDFCNLDSYALCLILERDTLKTGEIELFEAVVKWSEVESKKKNMPRDTVLEKPLSLIRFPLMTVEDFTQKVVVLGLLPTCQTVLMFLHFHGAPTPELIYNTTPRSGPCQQLANDEPSPENQNEAPMSDEADLSSAAEILLCEMTEAETLKRPSRRSKSFLCEEFVAEGCATTQNESVCPGGLDEAGLSNNVQENEPLGKPGSEKTCTSQQPENKTIKPMTAKIYKMRTKRTNQKNQMNKRLTIKTEDIGGMSTRASRQCYRNETTKLASTKLGKSEARKTYPRRTCHERNNTVQPSLAKTTNTGTKKTQKCPKNSKNSNASIQQLRKSVSLASRDKLLAGKGNLKTHMVSYLAERNFTCPHCNKVFSRNGNLKTHIQLHTGVLACKFCGKVFRQKESLKRHSLLHMKERKFHCTICSKSFTLKHNLIIHSEIHSGVKRFQCPQCDKAYFQKGNLKTHIAKHHSIVSSL